MAKHPAAFINAIAEEGTKEEAIAWLQKTWDELCDLKAQKSDARNGRPGGRTYDNNMWPPKEG